MQDATQVLLGSTLSSGREVEDMAGDPATFLAGICMSLKSDGTLSLLKSDGPRMAVSMGRSLSNHKKVSALKAGNGVPLLAHLKRSTGIVTITSVANLVSGTDDSITVGATVFTAQAGAVTPGDATFQASSTTTVTALSLATQINAHATASTLVYAVAAAALVTLYAIVEGAGTGHDVALAYTDGDANIGATVTGLSGGKLTGGSNTISSIAYMTKGSKAYINDVTGKLDIAMSGFSTVSDAVYIAGPLSGINEDADLVAAGVVDMQGGL